jgi:pilus assembly protein CpaC
MADVASVIRAAMPEAQIQVQTFNGIVVLNGTVASPVDVEQATSIVQGIVGKDVQVVSRLKTATPLQVMLQVKVAEVSRTLVKQIGVNLLSADTTGGFKFGIGQGRAAFPQFTVGPNGLGPLLTGTSSSAGTTTGTPAGTGTSLFGTSKLFGLNILSALDLAENDGRAHTLAEPTLTALSGETASFLAGGEFPIPVAQSSNAGGAPTITVQFKPFGVSLAFTPTLLKDGLINVLVNPEVSAIDPTVSVNVGLIQVPGVKVRRARTTVELHDGESFTIAGLLTQNYQSQVREMPFVGDIPILGALFKSNGYQRDETELVIVVTPHLVVPRRGRVALPGDGFVPPSDFELFLLGAQQGAAANVRPEDRALISGDPRKAGVEGPHGHVLY